MMGPQVSTVIWSLLSKTVPETDIGKVCTLVGCLQAVTTLAAAPVLRTIYNASLVTFPGAVYLYEAACMLVVLMIFFLVETLLKMQTRS